MIYLDLVMLLVFATGLARIGAWNENGKKVTGVACFLVAIIAVIYCLVKFSYGWRFGYLI